MRLIPLTLELAADLAAGDFSGVRFANLSEASDTLRDVAKIYGEFYQRVTPAAPWIGYLAEDESTGRIVGTCGYKGNCREGVVEIAYFSFPGHEGRGVGTEMARRLIDLAWCAPEVRIVRAHTLREENASGRILRKLGFIWLGTVDDPEDGPVWRWALKRS